MLNLTKKMGIVKFDKKKEVDFEMKKIINLTPSRKEMKSCGMGMEC